MDTIKQPDLKITGKLNPGSDCGVQKAERNFSLGWHVKKGLQRYGEKILGSFPRRIRMPAIDQGAWIYTLRAACASCLALYISFSLNLDGSHWAFTTCYIVGVERRSGQILAKSIARIVGTLVGATASFVLVNAFAQERLFIGFFVAWLAVCAFFSHYQRGHWAYAWVLSGYTAAIAGIPAALTPDLAFDVILSRVENVIIGIFCMGTVSMIFFPESVRQRLVKLVQATDQELFRVLSTSLDLKSHSSRMREMLSKLVANAVWIEDLRHGFAFEETDTGFSRANLGRFHLESLEVAILSSNLKKQLFSIWPSLENGALPCLTRALDSSYRAILTSIYPLEDTKTRDIYKRLDRELKQLQTSGFISAVENRQDLPIDAEVAVILQVRRLMACLLNYLETRSALFTEAPRRPGLAAKITTPVDTYVAAMAALRVLVSVGGAALFWIGTAWPSGDTFVIWAGIASCRQIIASNPARATEAMFRGMLIAAAPTYLITFYLLPQMDGFAMFVLALFPFVFLGVGIGISLRRPGEVGAAMLLLAGGLDPANEMQYDVVAFFNGVSATILGVGVVCLTHRLVFPSQADQRKVATFKRLARRTVRSIGQGNMTGIAYLGSVVIMLNDLLLLVDRPEESERNRADWALDLCGLGYEIINLQQAGGHLPIKLAYYKRRLMNYAH
ncbi:MAG TPA: FUSC family protein [Chthoniobacterales bacterium]|jgi:uncharacterized membrane protein YccC|nr:FUSC family protein [Chthoniobacterales bacterium]